MIILETGTFAVVVNMWPHAVSNLSSSSSSLQRMGDFVGDHGNENPDFQTGHKLSCQRPGSGFILSVPGELRGWSSGRDDMGKQKPFSLN